MPAVPPTRQPTSVSHLSQSIATPAAQQNQLHLFQHRAHTPDAPNGRAPTQTAVAGILIAADGTVLGTGGWGTVHYHTRQNEEPIARKLFNTRDLYETEFANYMMIQPNGQHSSQFLIKRLVCR